MSTLQEANKVAAILKKKLNKDWEIEVFENLGWHVHAANGVLFIYWDEYTKNSVKKPKFWCMMGEGDYSFAGSSLWTENNIYKSEDIHAILDRQVKLARKVINNLNKVIKSAESAVKKLEK